ncbi:MAG TPA: Gfo/Idh/MocA family oxidoreductase [Verrucomicrobiae bacterium]|nr:Gfo/Idh/MocA family oxidoreductase [Verrucomicrobiae bacterium]
MERKIKVGVVGCGAICGQYFNGLKPFGIVEVVACADIDRGRAEEKAAEFGVPRVCAVDELLRDPDVKIVINLTIPAAHAEINLAAINAGKHVYCEKPLAATRDDGSKTLEAAKAKGVRVGCAPDTFLGGGLQTCRKLIHEGAIGEPIAATAFMASHGPEAWHANPEFFFKPGGGPMHDMGPYYLTALVNLIGPMKSVAASTRITFPERVIRSQPFFGKKIKVEVPTHYSGAIDFANGAVGTMLFSFDVWGHHLPRIEIYGTEGSLSVPDPNRFDGAVRLRKAHEREWTEIPLTHSADVGRGIGVADMAYGIVSGRPHRASGELAYHVLDAMCSFNEAGKARRHIDLTSTCERPKPLPVGLPVGQLDP